MADDMPPINTGRLKLFDYAVRRKWNKYTWSGLVVLIVGLLVLVISMTIRIAYPVNVLLTGLGVLLMIIGIIRILIGFINPATPLDMVPAAPDQEEALLQEIASPLDTYHD